MTTRLLVVDDHPAYRRGLGLMLADAADITVVGEADTGEKALEQAAALTPDVILMDLRMPGLDGIEATRRLTRSGSAAAVVVLTMDSADASTLAALRAGARGYLLKETAAESIGQTVRALARGELVLDSQLASRLSGLLSRSGGGTGPAAATPELDALTPRELEIMALVARGLSNADIGRQLFLAEKTVRNNITTLLAKTSLPSRPALIAFARDRGIS